MKDWVARLVAMLLLCLVCQAEVFGDEHKTYQIELPAQTVAEALNSLAEQTDVPVIFPYKLAHERQANPVSGRYTMQQALDILLQGTELSGGLSNNGVLTISLATSEANNQRGNSMKVKDKTKVKKFSALILAIFGASNVAGQESVPNSERMLQEIVVTAQKREQSINEVPMSISAISGERWRELGLSDVSDLSKITPGFKFTNSLSGTPVYFIRGVGFDDIALAARPTVSVYQDQAPIPFAITARGVSMDVERVEILKGPQGTLFGNNATGGAINFIANKPTETFEAGLDMSYGNYDTTQLFGFVSGPITDSVNMRVALEHSGMGEWQESFTTNAELGEKDFTNARVMLDWSPSDDLRVSLGVNRWVDRSDTQASRLLAINLRVPPLAALFPEVVNYPLPTDDGSEVADFNLDKDLERDDDFTSFIGRIDYDLKSDLTLTSITTYQRYDHDQITDVDGTTIDDSRNETSGSVKSFAQELRLGWLGDRGNLTVGANYAYDETRELVEFNTSGSTLSLLFAGLGFAPLQVMAFTNDQDQETMAVFASGDYDLTPTVNVYGGVRYTDYEVDQSTCTYDPANGVAAQGFSVVHNGTRAAAGLGPLPLAGVDECFTLLSNFEHGIVKQDFNEDNVSWRIGLQWEPTDEWLVYANVSEGFKVGSFPTVVVSVEPSAYPATQESLLAYELGFKLSLSNVLLTGAGFYYDYEDKQVLGRLNDPLLGSLSALVNIPDSQVIGGELELTWYPTAGLSIFAGASYVDSEIGDYANVDSFGVPKDFKGESFPNTPEWYLNGGVRYEFPVGELSGFVSGNMNYQSKTHGQLGENNPLLRMPSYTLVDAQVGLQDPNDSWRAWLWVKNVGDETYYTSAAKNIDTVNAFMGMPRTFGVSVSFRF